MRKVGFEYQKSSEHYPIRILHVVTAMNRAGLETMLMNYYRNINRSKIQFDFLVHRKKESDYDKEINQLGGQIYHLPRLIPWSISYKRKLRNFFIHHKEYKIVHVHQDCLSSVALKCAKKERVPVRIAHSHNSSQDKNLKYLIKRYYMHFIPKYATELFACGKDAGDWMFMGHPYKLVKNAIDAKKYCYSKNTAKLMRNNLNICDEIVIGHVGRFISQKNHIFLLRVFYECLNINQNIKLLLVGDGDDFEIIKQKVIDLGIQDKVIFTGVRSDVYDLMQAMDVFVFPSLYEGLPLTLIEAQAAGLHCVISDRVPKECEICSDLITYCNLDDEVSKWARLTLKQASLPRKNHIQEIIDSGYDIVSAAKKLEEYYLNTI